MIAGCGGNSAVVAVMWLTIASAVVKCHPAVMSETAASSLETVARPTRPKTFGSPGELRTYLDQLGQYLAVVSRPRFGKRKQSIIVPGKYYLGSVQQHSAFDNNSDQEPTYPPIIRNAKDLYQLLFGPRHVAYGYLLRQQQQPQQYFGDFQDSSTAVGADQRMSPFVGSASNNGVGY